MTSLAPATAVASPAPSSTVSWGQAGVVVVAVVSFLWLADVQGLFAYWLRRGPFSTDDWLRAGVAYAVFACLALWHWDRLLRVLFSSKFWILALAATATIAASSWFGVHRHDAVDPRGSMPLLRASEVAKLAVVNASGVSSHARTWQSPLPASLQDLKTDLQGQDSARAGSGSPFVYELPQGWTAQPTSQMRLVNLRPADDARAECFVTQLGGDGGGVLANVNRWRTGQMGLPAITDADLAKLPRTKMFGRDAVLVELDGAFNDSMSGRTLQEARMLAAIVSLPMATISVKMVGPRDLVARERAGFDKFVASLALAGQGAKPAANPTTPPPAADAGKPAAKAQGTSGLRWTAPSEWTLGAPRAMREATFVPKGAAETECVVSILGGDGGGLLANINRWRVDQFGAAALTEQEAAKLPKIAVLGKEGTLVEARGNYTGMGGVKRDDYGLLGFICPLEGRVLFVKMVGPAAQVESERERFVAFCKSLGKE